MDVVTESPIKLAVTVESAPSMCGVAFLLACTNDRIDERLEGEIAVGYHASKEYTKLIGIPPVFVSTQVPGQWVAEANVAFQPFERWALRLWLKVQTSIPHLAVDSPAPAAATTGSVGMIGVEWRR